MITAANSSKINDGAAGLVLMSEEVAKDRGHKPLVRIFGFNEIALESIDFVLVPA